MDAMTTSTCGTGRSQADDITIHMAETISPELKEFRRYRPEMAVITDRIYQQVERDRIRESESVKSPIRVRRIRRIRLVSA